MIKKLFLCVGLLVLLTTSQATQAFAATTTVKANPKPLVTIAPFLQQVQILPSDSVKTFDISLTNNSANTQSFHLTAIDFGSLDETGGLVFAGSNPSSFTKNHGLASWLQLQTSDLDLAAGQTTKVQVSIINDVNLQPGGHYAAIVASLKNTGNGGGNKIDIKQELSALVLATKVGGEKYDLHLDSLQYDSSWWHVPQALTLRFYNPGNVHVVPRGIVKLIAPNGQLISEGAINEASSFVLPGTYRQIPVVMQSVGHADWWRIGLYHIKVDYRYDGINQYASKTYAVRSLNFLSLLLIVAILLFATWLLVKYWRQGGLKNGKVGKNSKTGKNSKKTLVPKVNSAIYKERPKAIIEKAKEPTKVAVKSDDESVTEVPVKKPRKSTKKASKTPSKKTVKDTIKSDDS